MGENKVTGSKDHDEVGGPAGFVGTLEYIKSISK